MNAPQVSFHDLRPPDLDLAQAVIAGLTMAPKAIPPKFFYDARGSKLFDAICAQPEYYLPDAEREIFQEWGSEIARGLGNGLVLLEPGAGSALKVRWLLEDVKPTAYVPIDISDEHLSEAIADLADHYPWLQVHAAVADFTHSLPIPEAVPDAPRAAFFPGSSLGNFEPESAAAFLELVRGAVAPEGRLLIGVDRKKEAAILDAAYNDAAGVTADFNRNLLHRINHELGADFQLDKFAHRAWYDEEAGRVEMHLVSTERQSVRIDGASFEFAEGESIHTENSYKYSPEELVALAGQAGFRCVNFWTDPRQYFGVYLLEAD